jgi:uncharacterized damage-inducible protein DinB
MSAPQWLLSDFDEEIASTRRFLERVPEDRLAWRPHPASATLGELASHIAELPGWTRAALKQDARDYPAENGGGREPLPLDTVPDILSFFDQNCADGRRIIQDTTDEELARSWNLAGSYRPLFTGTKAAVFRRMVLRHLVHHRGQLSVYLRLVGVPVPPAYGPTADAPG